MENHSSPGGWFYTDCSDPQVKGKAECVRETDKVLIGVSFACPVLPSRFLLVTRWFDACGIFNCYDVSQMFADAQELKGQATANFHSSLPPALRVLVINAGATNAAIQGRAEEVRRLQPKHRYATPFQEPFSDMLPAVRRKKLSK